MPPLGAVSVEGEAHAGLANNPRQCGASIGLPARWSLLCRSALARPGGCAIMPYPEPLQMPSSFSYCSLMKTAGGRHGRDTEKDGWRRVRSRAAPAAKCPEWWRGPHSGCAQIIRSAPASGSRSTRARIRSTEWKETPPRSALAVPHAFLNNLDGDGIWLVCARRARHDKRIHDAHNKRCEAKPDQIRGHGAYSA